MFSHLFNERLLRNHKDCIGDVFYMSLRTSEVNNRYFDEFIYVIGTYYNLIFSGF